MEESALPQLIGIYQVSTDQDVSLIEIKMNILAREFDVSSFTQQDDSNPREDWQVAYNEHFLNEDGTKVVGTFGCNNMLSVVKTRVVFFMYFVDTAKPLISRYGELLLSTHVPLPERLAKIIDFDVTD